MSRNGFIRLMRGDKTTELLKNPDAFTLAAVIALRARRTDDFNVYGLVAGESLLGDYGSYGLTQQRYRTAKRNLQRWKIATFKSTSRGTIAKLIDADIYDINLQVSGEQPTNRQLPANEQPTTNKNDKKDKNEKNDKNNKESSSPDNLQKPSAVEVCEYAKSIGFELNGQQFIDFYQSKGWLIGKNKMKDWRAAVRTWKQRSNEGANNARSRIYRTDTEYKSSAAAEGCIEI